MRLLILFLLFSVAYAGFFDIFGGKKKEEVVHVTKPDTGELGWVSDPNMGREIEIGRGRTDGNGGRLVDIPKNSDAGKTTKPPIRPTPKPSISVITPPPPTPTSTRWTTTEKAVTRILPSQETHREGCPSRVDAFTAVGDRGILFDGNNVYFVEGGRLSESGGHVAQMFPGVSKVNAAVYDQDKEVLVLISERKVYGFRVQGRNFAPHGDYPKDLPDNIAFTPNGAMRWHDGHQMLLSSGGQFALYDEYWNKSLMSGRAASYYEGLPDRLRGVSEWKNGKATMYTQSLVFEYDKDRKGVVGEGQTIGNFLRC